MFFMVQTWCEVEAIKSYPIKYTFTTMARMGTDRIRIREYYRELILDSIKYDSKKCVNESRKVAV